MTLYLLLGQPLPATGNHDKPVLPVRGRVFGDQTSSPTEGNSGEEGVWTPSRTKNKTYQCADEFMEEPKGIHPFPLGNELVVYQGRLTVKRKQALQ